MGVAAFLGLSSVAFTATTAIAPDNEVVETACRAVPAGDGERVLAAHEQAVARQHRRRLVGIGVVVAITPGVASLAGFPKGLVAVGGLAVLLAYGVLTKPKTKARLFAPEIV